MPSGFLKVFGTGFVVFGMLDLALGVIAVIALLLSGGDSEGWALVAMAIGSGMAFLFIGYALRRLAIQ